MNVYHLADIQCYLKMKKLNTCTTIQPSPWIATSSCGGIVGKEYVWISSLLSLVTLKEVSICCPVTKMDKSVFCVLDSVEAYFDKASSAITVSLNKQTELKHLLYMQKQEQNNLFISMLKISVIHNY